MSGLGAAGGLGGTGWVRAHSVVERCQTSMKSLSDMTEKIGRASLMIGTYQTNRLSVTCKIAYLIPINPHIP